MSVPSILTSTPVKASPELKSTTVPGRVTAFEEALEGSDETEGWFQAKATPMKDMKAIV